MQSVERKRIYLETYAIQLRMQSNRIKSVRSNNRCIRLIFNHFKELFAFFSGRLWADIYIDIDYGVCDRANRAVLDLLKKASEKKEAKKEAIYLHL